MQQVPFELTRIIRKGTRETNASKTGEGVLVEPSQPVNVLLAAAEVVWSS